MKIDSSVQHTRYMIRFCSWWANRRRKEINCLKIAAAAADDDGGDAEAATSNSTTNANKWLCIFCNIETWTMTVIAYGVMWLQFTADWIISSLFFESVDSLKWHMLLQYLFIFNWKKSRFFLVNFLLLFLAHHLHQWYSTLYSYCLTSTTRSLLFNWF